MSVLVVAEHRRGKVRDVTYELISAARELEGSITVAILGRESVAVDLRRIGVDEVVQVQIPTDEFENDTYQQVLEALIAERKPEVVLLGFTVNSIAYAPAVAAKLGLGFASDVFALRREGDCLIATRAFHGSKVHADIDFPGAGTVILLLRPKVWAQSEAGGSPTVTDFAVATTRSRARHKEFLEQAISDVDITGADFLLAIGRGIGDKENVALFERLSQRMRAVLVASRPLVDVGWISSSRQVGQSGQTVKPKVYLSLGISGAPEHLAGMRDSGTIIAVNTDPQAPLFNVAHYGAVADLFEVARELEKLY